MKYQRSSEFLSDYARLPREHRPLFLGAVRLINEAYARRGSRWPPEWPVALRIKRVQEVAGVWEMTWSFSRPDGRATFEFVQIDGEPGIRWRRIGTHEILGRP